MSQKNDKIDSVQAETDIVAGAYTQIEPPEHITMAEGDMPFFYNVIAEFAKADWSKHQLELLRCWHGLWPILNVSNSSLEKKVLL